MKKARSLQGATEGYLAIKQSWPGQIRTVYGDHQRMLDTYFSPFPGYYFTGDGALRDSDGYLRITGRVDDVLNVSGHRMGTAEIESALGRHELIAEAAVVGFPHDIKGQGIYAYVTPMVGRDPSEELRQQLSDLCVSRNWRHSQARCYSVGSRVTEDSLGENHAAHSAQDSGK